MNDLGNTHFLTISEVAELLSVSVSQVYNLVHSGELVALRVGRRGPWRVDAQVVEDFIAQQYELARRNSLWRESSFAAANNILDF
jgi:excisionase family DNA binding protein